MTNYNVLLALCWMVTMEIGLLGASSNLTVTPPVFDLMTEMPLTVNCTFDYSHTSNVSNLVSILISKEDDLSQDSSKFSEMVSITLISPNVVKVLTPVTASVSGHVSKDGTSFLSLRWEHPSLKEEGFYHCHIAGLDESGRCVETTHISQVTAYVPSNDEVVESVRRQQTAIIDLQQKMNQTSTNRQVLESGLQEMTIKDLEEKLNETSATLAVLITSHTSTEAELKNLTVSVNNFKLESKSRLLRILNYYKISDVYNGTYYLLSKEGKVHINSSQEECALMGGYLAEIDDSEENTFITSFITSTGVKNDVIIGGTDEATEGKWVWKNSQRPLSFTNWDSGEPNGDATENCMFLRTEQSWKWNDYTCKLSRYLFHFLCEIKSK